jgi:anti-anti-sigma regulatory factor
MLRITIHENAKAQTIQLEGKIAGPWVEELTRIWLSLVPPVGSRALCLDLRDVAFVDAKGKHLLREMYQNTNVRFLVDSPLTQHFADDARQQSPKSGEEGV